MIVVLAIALAVIFFIGNAVRVIRSNSGWHRRAAGKVQANAGAGATHLVVPLFDEVRYNLDMPENVVPFRRKE